MNSLSAALRCLGMCWLFPLLVPIHVLQHEEVGVHTFQGKAHHSLFGNGYAGDRGVRVGSSKFSVYKQRHKARAACTLS